jgi:electron transfer flavoprotein beta subunit
MKIAVCMKQVPAVSEGNMDPETGVLIRAGLESIVNVYDLAALEAALSIKEFNEAKIHVFTMGPEKAEAVLREAFAMGADEGWLICDRAFAGADVLATSYTLMQSIRAAGDYDLILCGKQTTDGDTAQVSGSLARWMNIPHVNRTTEISCLSSEKILVKYNMENSIVTAGIKLPCLISVEKQSFVPRMPSLKLKISGKKKVIHRLMLNDLGEKEQGHYGLSGSATRVCRIFPPERTRRQAPVIREKKAAAEYILNILAAEKQGRNR